jgi:hypothetical protein
VVDLLENQRLVHETLAYDLVRNPRSAQHLEGATEPTHEGFDLVDDSETALTNAADDAVLTPGNLLAEAIVTRETSLWTRRSANRTLLDLRAQRGAATETISRHPRGREHSR